MNVPESIDAVLWLFGLPMMSELFDELLPAIQAQQDLVQCPPFRECKSRKWQRRRNKQFYRILDGLKREKPEL